MRGKDLDNRVLNYLELLIKANNKISVRSIAKWLWKINSIRSIQLSLTRLEKAWLILKTHEWKIELIQDDFSIKEKVKTKIKTQNIPLIGSIACGWPTLAEENIESYMSISQDFLKDRKEYFLLRTTWDSMDKKWINPWDVVLIRQENTAKNWDIVVALIDDSATLKEIKMEYWIVKLIPHSTNPDNKIIVVTEDLIIQWIYERNLGQF